MQGGVVKIIAGALLIIAGLIIAPYFPMIGYALVYAGVGLMLGGVVELLTPVPKMKDNSGDDRSSSVFHKR